MRFHPRKDQMPGTYSQASLAAHFDNTNRRLGQSMDEARDIVVGI